MITSQNTYGELGKQVSYLWRSGSGAAGPVLCLCGRGSRQPSRSHALDASPSAKLQRSSRRNAKSRLFLAGQGERKHILTVRLLPTFSRSRPFPLHRICQQICHRPRSCQLQLMLVVECHCLQCTGPFMWTPTGLRQ